MNNKQRATLAAVFRKPTTNSIRWSDIESMLKAVGCSLVEGSGSRVTFAKDGVVASFHRPHPAKEAKRYQVRDAAKYLEKLGLGPTGAAGKEIDDERT